MAVAAGRGGGSFGGGAAISGRRRRAVAFAAGRSIAGNGRHGGHRAGHRGHFARGPVYGGFGVFGFGVPYAFGEDWGYPDDEPDCYLRRVRVHHHWVWRQYCD